VPIPVASLLLHGLGADIAAMYLPHLLQGLSLCICISSAKFVRETLEYTWETGAPNGGEPRELVFTNGQFPGPDLVWDEDDDIQVR
jgi:hypothetical protein